MNGMIDFYNLEVARFKAAHPGLAKVAREAKVDGFINNDPTQISWNRSLKQSLPKTVFLPLSPNALLKVFTGLSPSSGSISIDNLTIWSTKCRASSQMLGRRTG